MPKVRETVKIAGETYEILESDKTYTVRKLINKLKKNKPLDQIESQMASGVIEDWLRIKQAQIKAGKNHGRPSRFNGKQEKIDFFNAKRKKENQGLSEAEILEKIRRK